MNKFLWGFYGNIYNDEYEHLSDGGPKCYDDIPFYFRISVALVSTILNIFIMVKCYKTIKISKECSTQLNAKPNWFEKWIGLMCIGTYLIILGYKLYTGRGMFINNPCHVVLLVQGYLLVTKKSYFNGLLYICILRWSYGTFSAMSFPVVTGLDLPLEVEFFWIEHILEAIVGPIVLTMFGRYGHFEYKTFLYHQLFGFASHTLYQRIHLTTLSLLTMANLNFTLCRSDSDPFYPLLGNWYYLFAEIYLNVASVISVHIIMALCLLFRVTNSKKLD